MKNHSLKFKIKGISHITLKVSNAKKSYNFYCKVFDSKFEWDDEKTFCLLKTGLPIWIFEGKTSDKDSHLHHLAFSVSNPDLKRIKAHLEEEKINHSSIMKFAEQYPLIELKDPDGVVLEFFVD